LPDVKLEVHRVDLDGSRVRAERTFTAPAFASPIKGHDIFEIRDGKIAQHKIVATAMPAMENTGGTEI